MKLLTLDINELTKNEYNKWYSLMSDHKKEKVNRKKLEDKRKCTVAGEMLAKKGIAELLNIPAETIVFDTTEKGKPYAKNLDIHFNISHSGTMVVCAVNDKEIGIDVEKIRPMDLKVTKRFCTENELRYIFGYIPKEKDFSLCKNPKVLNKFFEIWTAKEAYFKCIGTGITDLKSIDCVTLPMSKKMILLDDYIIQIIVNSSL